ncbi:MAG TPA: LEA type 2 family protein [Burkholderiaceae bacterium]|nr:LEA type 2 family protein [Burkholderiaceae bacterium]
MIASRLQRAPTALARWLRAAIAALVAAVAIVGCSALPPPDLKPPTVSVSDLQLADLGLERVRFVITVQAHNPNRVDLPLNNLRIDLSLLEQPFAHGAARDPRLTLAREASRDIPIEFEVPTARLLDLARAAWSAESRLTYQLRGSANWGDTAIVIPFERRGEFELLRRLRELMRIGARG